MILNMHILPQLRHEKKKIKAIFSYCNKSFFLLWRLFRPKIVPKCSFKFYFFYILIEITSEMSRSCDFCILISFSFFKNIIFFSEMIMYWECWQFLGSFLHSSIWWSSSPCLTSPKVSNCTGIALHCLEKLNAQLNNDTSY